ncbi:Cuticle protein 6 [Camponotus floridanus]|uniref:Cuticle protein 6 n=1 Tax=Camponotus floridanus TaxID=104421 RepID=E1ZYF0_CAMFO|nr:uncharacterized protein LOC105256716 [Camponotus floridanus]EFN73849.1 Cuticle protein 6 [Camponotus floridanus]
MSESRIHNRRVVRETAMKTASLFLVHCLIAAGFAKPTVFLGYQDSLGQYSFGYSAPGSARSEVRTSNGATRGTYSYVDETGVIQTAQYVADSENGFRVFATNLPQAPLPVQDTPEVMAARTAHLQALELATRRNEQAQSQENAQERKSEGNQGDASVSKTQEQLEAKKVQDNAKKIEEKNNEESLQAVASRSGIDKASDKNSQEIREESSGRVTEEIVNGANIPAIPLISSRVLPQISGGNAVPIFRISHGSHEIEPSSIPETPIQGTSGAITPAATILKSTAISGNQVAVTPEKEQQKQRANEPVVNAIAPSSVIPLSSSHSSFIRYESPFLHYVVYNIL